MDKNGQVSFDGDAMRVSRYFKRFQRLVALNERRDQETHYSAVTGEPITTNVINSVNGPMVLKGNTILVERLPKVEMKTKSGLIIATHSSYKDTHADRVTDFGLVLMTGPGEVLDDGTVAEMEVKPGDVILLPQSVYWYSTFGTMADYDNNSIGLTRDSAALMVFSDYKKAFEVLNEA